MKPVTQLLIDVVLSHKPTKIIPIDMIMETRTIHYKQMEKVNEHNAIKT